LAWLEFRRVLFRSPQNPKTPNKRKRR